jgi:hypothetical protein
MHDEFGYLGRPGAVPKRAVTAQMLRDLISIHSSLPADDQWQTLIWINLLEPFAEEEDVTSFLGDSPHGITAVAQHYHPTPQPGAPNLT